MTLGIPPDITFYKLITDWGSLIGSLITGILALVAAAIAYRAALRQVKATGEAAMQQIAAIERQRSEEVANIRDAVRVEVTAFTKDIIAALEVCQHIKTTPNISREQAQLITKILKGPVVYPAIADRVGLLSHTHATVQFYGRIIEANVALEYLTQDVSTVADSLITAL
jgi:hypothetical protein